MSSISSSEGPVVGSKAPNAIPTHGPFAGYIWMPNSHPCAPSYPETIVRGYRLPFPAASTCYPPRFFSGAPSNPHPRSHPVPHPRWPGRVRREDGSVKSPRRRGAAPHATCRNLTQC
eukprot:scaffold19799_cov129-Isochrysis_galbana.AAC.1